VSLTFNRPHRATDVAGLTALLAGALAVRVALAGPAGGRSVPAGLVFGLVLGTAALAAGIRVQGSVRTVLIGLGGAGVLLAPVAIQAGIGIHPAAPYLPWAAATAVVATAEEAFLRGALFDALSRWRGVNVAVIGGAIAFALLHVPLYGWHAVPLDLAVGLLLGALRLLAGTWTAPAIAHVAADLGGWWLL
jgi:membrane protease YdiL (CAAX protease family)